MQDETLRKAFGARLKQLRKQKNWAQKELADALAVPVDFLLTGNPVEDSPLASSRLFKRFKVLEALAEDDQETVIKVIDAMIAKQRMTSALTSVDVVA